MKPLRLAVVGLDNSHPIVDIHNLAALGREVRVSAVLADIGPRLDDLDAITNGSATRCTRLAEVLATNPDAILVTLRPSRLLPVLDELAATGLPTFLNRPAVVTAHHWRQLPEVFRSARNLMTSSVLRFASPVLELAAWSRVRDLRRVMVAARHGTAHWALPGNEWQADQGDGGGALGALAYHAVELALAVLPSGVAPAVIGCKASRNGAFCCPLTNASGASVELTLQATPEERYTVAVESADGARSIHLDGTGIDPFGYGQAMAAFLRFVEAGERDRSWLHTLTSMRTSVSLFEAARRSGGIALGDPGSA